MTGSSDAAQVGSGSSVGKFLEAARNFGSEGGSPPVPSLADAAASTATPSDSVLVSTLRDYADRTLSEREVIRIGAVSSWAAARIRDRIEYGHNVRDDGFFELGDGATRSDAEEVVDGLLAASQRSHEERKIPYMANLLANIGFESAIDTNSANRAVWLSESLTWGDYKLLALIGRRDSINIPEGIEIGQNIRDWRASTIHEQLHDLLWTRQLIHGEKTDQSLAFELHLNRQGLRGPGLLLFNLLQLDLVPEAELQEIVRALI